MLAHLQPARRTRRDLGHRASGLHRSRSRALAPGRTGLLRLAREARVSDGKTSAFDKEEKANLNDGKEEGRQGAGSGEPARRAAHRGAAAKIASPAQRSVRPRSLEWTHSVSAEIERNRGAR